MIILYFSGNILYIKPIEILQADDLYELYIKERYINIESFVRG